MRNDVDVGNLAFLWFLVAMFSGVGCFTSLLVGQFADLWVFLGSGADGDPVSHWPVWLPMVGGTTAGAGATRLWMALNLVVTPLAAAGIYLYGGVRRSGQTS